MKILVISDSHGRTGYLESILKKNAVSCDIIVHCGDGADEMLSMNEYTYGKNVFLCKGNCDSSIYGFAELNTFPAGNKNVMACHGHWYKVKYGYNDIFFAAKEKGSDICLFGHTHEPFYEFYDGTLFLNPGAVASGNYAIIEIRENNIIPSLYSIQQELF